MIITFKRAVEEAEIADVCEVLERDGFQVTPVLTQLDRYIVALGSTEVDIRRIGYHPAVKDVHVVSDPYKLVSRKWKAAATSIEVGGDINIESGGCTVIAGPCSVESEEEMAAIAAFLREQGIQIMRGGAFKPRTSPYSFRGHGIEGLKMFHRIAHDCGLSIVSEVVSAAHIEAMYDYIDVYQVGTRNSQNFDLLAELGKVDKPVLLKRAMSGTIDELLQSAEYIFASGNERLVLCERGIRGFERSYRNTMDLNAVPALKEKTHLPVIIDPSHGIGVRRWVTPLALAGLMAGADGMMVEIHRTPERALSDSQQTLSLPEAGRLFAQARQTFDMRDSFIIN